MPEIEIRQLGSGQEMASEWHPPPPKRLPSPACLTDFLRQVPEFERSLLPRSQSAVIRLNRLVRALPYVQPSSTTRKRGWYGRVGLALDRAALHAGGADIATKPLAYLSAHRTRAAKAIAGILRAYTPPPARFGGQVSNDLLGWLWILGGLEPVMRGFVALSDIDTSRIPVRPSKTTAKAWLAHVVPRDVQTELRQLIDALGLAMPSGRILPNPIFGGWGAIVGSDGDLIAEDMLVELKCTVAGAERGHAAQLLCYWAIDQLNGMIGKPKYGFARLALSLPRHSCLVTGTVNEWLAAFGGPEPAVLVQGFAKFAVTFYGGTHQEVRLFPPYEWVLGRRGALRS